MAREGPEVRFGLVLYGGVSLAIYIYGIVVEVQRLLQASEERERGEELESPYAQALEEAGAARVSVDLLSGTSAGGINGVLLAKALARGSDVAAVRDLWLDGGDIEQLLQPPSVADPRSLLQSKYFEAQLRSGIGRLDEPAPAAPSPPSILDLFISSTRLRGGQRLFRDSLGVNIPTRQYRYVFQLKLRRRGSGPIGSQGYDADDFSGNERLVKLARSTSAFPFAFEPVQIDQEDGLLEPGESAGWFADGGILNNKPFTEAIATIATRSAEQPVQRWLLSVDPDPETPQVEDRGAGPMPDFDRVVVNSIATIPRYQSIVRDLTALREHNEKVIAAEQAIAAGEAQARRNEPEDGDLGSVLDGAYRAMKRQAWAKAVADALVVAVVDDARRPEDLGEIHRLFRITVEQRAQDPETEAADLAFQRRRIYYLIKLISMAAPDLDAPDLGGVKAALWGEFEEISAAIWNALSAVPMAHQPPVGLDAWAFTEATDRLAVAEGPFAATAADIEGRLSNAVGGVVVSLRVGDQILAVDLAEVYADFERRDAPLLSAEVYGGLQQRDRIDHAQISPVSAANTGVAAQMKLAGTTLGHFGGFLDRGWRRNDLMWGRLDGAEILLRAILGEQEDDSVARRLCDAAQEQIVGEEMPKLTAAPGDWKEGLQIHAKSDRSDGELNGRRLLSIGLRAAEIVRKMLRTAADDANSGGVLYRARAFALRGVANLLGFALALVYLPATAFFAKGRLVQRAATLAALLPFLWGVATLVLGLLGVFELGEVAVPALVGIAVYPLFLAVYWCLVVLGRRLGRTLNRARR